MARSIVKDTDVAFEEALMESMARNEFNKKQTETIKTQSEWSRFIQYVKWRFRIEWINIRALIILFFQ